MISDEQYLDTQNKMILSAGVFGGLDLYGFIERINHTEATAPITDPTLYRNGQARLLAIKRFAESLIPAQAAYREMQAVILSTEILEKEKAE